MDFAKAFSFVFDDPDWIKKVLIVALVALIPIVGQLVVMGWGLEVTRRVIQRDPSPLPALDFGAQLGIGFRGFVVGLVYALPALLLQLPTIIGSSLVDSSASDATITAFSAITICCSSLVVLYALFLAFILPAAYGNFVAQNRLGAAFKFGEVLGLLRANPGAYLLTFVGVLVAGFISGLGVIACAIGVLATYTYGMAVQGHLYGQAYLASVHNQAYR